MSTDSSGSNSSDDQTQPDDVDNSDQQQSADSNGSSDNSTAPPKVQVTVNSGSPARAALPRYQKKYYPYTPGDVSSYMLACSNALMAYTTVCA